MKNSVTVQIGSGDVRLRFSCPGTDRYFRRFRKDPAAEGAAETAEVSEPEFQKWEEAEGEKKGAFAEFCLLCMPVSEILLKQDKCIFHAAALRRKDKAWLIAGGSGVGKSTQCRTLTELWPEEFSVINGDKPALEFRKDETGNSPDMGVVWVHPSPWNGKEGWRGAEAAPLVGIFLLRRGDTNEIRKLTREQAAPRVFSSVFQSYGNEEMIRGAAGFCDKLLKAVPVWLLTSSDIPESTRLLYRTISEEAVSIK